MEASLRLALQLGQRHSHGTGRRIDPLQAMLQATSPKNLALADGVNRGQFYEDTPRDMAEPSFKVTPFDRSISLEWTQVRARNGAKHSENDPLPQYGNDARYG
jgi:hypothetical protein